MLLFCPSYPDFVRKTQLTRPPDKAYAGLTFYAGRGVFSTVCRFPRADSRGKPVVVLETRLHILILRLRALTLQRRNRQFS